MKLSFGCELAYDVAEPAVFVLHVEAARIASHAGLADELRIVPDLPRDAGTATLSENRITRFVAPPGALTVTYSGSVDLHALTADPVTIGEMAAAELPLDVLPFLLPSRYCESDRLGEFAKQHFGSLLPGFSRVTAICHWICANIEYRAGSSDNHTSACQILEVRAGVCRDFAHVGVAICRALDIPARFVSCYAFGLNPVDFHAVFEAYLGDHWWLFDATREPALDGLIRIAAGRDAADVPFASLFSAAALRSLKVWIEAAGRLPIEGERTVAAIRTA
ncbi:MAG: transglutaminase family protein [Pseudolabrys sp.]|nr:transglutaminase family protein [Pseudolabrys sp.]